MPSWKWNGPLTSASQKLPSALSWCWQFTVSTTSLPASLSVPLCRSFTLTIFTAHTDDNPITECNDGAKRAQSCCSLSNTVGCEALQSHAVHCITTGGSSGWKRKTSQAWTSVLLSHVRSHLITMSPLFHKLPVCSMALGGKENPARHEHQCCCLTSGHTSSQCHHFSTSYQSAPWHFSFLKVWYKNTAVSTSIMRIKKDKGFHSSSVPFSLSQLVFVSCNCWWEWWCKTGGGAGRSNHHKFNWLLLYSLGSFLALATSRMELMVLWNQVLLEAWISTRAVLSWWVRSCFLHSDSTKASLVWASSNSSSRTCKGQGTVTHLTHL